jgi:Domain of unknown function (DUF4190)
MNTPAKQTSTMAIISLSTGIAGIILGWNFVPFLASIVAVITGHMARKEIRNSNGTIEGDGLALAGLIMGWAMIVLSVLSVIAIILFFGGLMALLAMFGIASANGG